MQDPTEIPPNLRLPLDQTMNLVGPSPPSGAGFTLEGANNLVGDPSSVEAAGLGSYSFSINRAADPIRIEGDPAGVVSELGVWVWVAPSDGLVGPWDR